MKNKQLVTERKQFMKIAGLLKEDDYDMGTPSGDTDDMNIAEAGPHKYPYSYTSVNDKESAVEVVEEIIEYITRFADTDDEGGMNEAGKLLPGLEDLKSYLMGMKHG